jgi:hypothetical protein
MGGVDRPMPIARVQMVVSLLSEPVKSRTQPLLRGEGLQPITDVVLVSVAVLLMNVALLLDIAAQRKNTVELQIVSLRMGQHATPTKFPRAQTHLQSQGLH